MDATLAAWCVVGQDNGVPPIVGEVYEVRSQRKGNFVARVEAIDGDFAEVRILVGTARALLVENIRGKGETVFVRGTLAVFVPYKRAAK